MNTLTENSKTALSRWTYFFRMMRGFLGILLLAVTTIVLCTVVFFNGCRNESPGIVNVCDVPIVIRTSPANSVTNVSLNGTSSAKVQVMSVKDVQASTLASAASVKIITATFSTPMNPNTITTTSFTVQQGSTYLSGSVSYSDTTAIFIVPNGLGPNLVYTCTITTGAKDLEGTALASNYVWTFTTIAPGTPTLVAPFNGAVSIATSPTLSWNVVTGADTYRLQVSTSSTFASTVYNDSTRTTTSQTITGLTVGTVYYWRVNSKISGGTSAYSNTWSFTTIAAPLAPVLIAPLDAAVNVATSPTLSWNASTGAATYRLQVSTDTLFASTIYNDSTITNTSQAITGLTVGTKYYWRVNAKNAAGTSAYAARTFTTITPGVPTLVAPADTSVNISTSPTLSWNVVTGADTYRLQVSTSSTFASTVYNDSTRTTTSQAITGLTIGTKYYWRVNSKISGGTSAYSNTWSFTTIALPAAPVLVTPADVATNISTTPILSWNVVSGAATYRLQVSTSSTFASTIFNDSTLATTSQALSGLSVGTTYYWRVNAKNAAGTGVYSSTWSFTTIAPPAAPVLVAPLTLAIVSTTTPTLSWNASTGAVTYRLQVSTDSLFASTIYNDSTLTGLLQSISGLTGGTTYYWRVNAKNANGTSVYSSVWSFTTVIPYTVSVSSSPAYGTAIGGGTFNSGSSVTVTAAVTTTGAGFTRWTDSVTGLTASYNASYTFTITGDRKLVANFGQAPVRLPANVSTFAILAGSAVTDAGASYVYGDVGSFPTSTITGLLPTQVSGTLYTSADPIVGTAKDSLLVAYNDAAVRSLASISLPGQLGGLTLAPGLYTNSSSSGINGTGTNAILTLDAGGDSNAVWIFQMGTTLITTTGTSVVLAGGAQWKNIYWQVGSSATLGTYSTFYGNILSDAATTLTTGAKLYGRALTRSAAVTMDASIIDNR
jgi:hypothetical protein